MIKQFFVQWSLKGVQNCLIVYHLLFCQKIVSVGARSRRRPLLRIRVRICSSSVALKSVPIFVVLESVPIFVALESVPDTAVSKFWSVMIISWCYEVVNQVCFNFWLRVVTCNRQLVLLLKKFWNNVYDRCVSILCEGNDDMSMVSF